MKLLFDQNLSFKLVSLLADVFPQSNQVRQVGLDRADDAIVWQFSKQNEFALVSKDSDFADLAALHGPPPKVIWLRCGNQPNAAIETRLRSHVNIIEAFDRDHEAACLEIF
jgi:predicted nuclease of predicted toxin-antitoxin system